MYIAFFQPVKCFIDLLHIDHFNISSNIMFDTKIEYFLSFGNTANIRTGKTFSSFNKIKSSNWNLINRQANQYKCTVNFQQVK